MEADHPVFALLATLLWLQAQPAASSEIVAVVNGEPITAAELDEAIQPQWEAIRQRRERFRRTVLLKLIDNRLPEQAALAAGQSVDAYLRANVEQVTVPEEEVETAYWKRRDRFVGALAPEARHRIRRGLKDNRRAVAFGRRPEALCRNGGDGCDRPESGIAPRARIADPRRPAYNLALDTRATPLSEEISWPLSRICKLILAPAAPVCDTGRFLWPGKCQTRRIVW